jgi:membrane fusion protein, heavy metal efflux system
MRVHSAIVILLMTVVACRRVDSDKVEEQEKPGSPQALQMGLEAQKHISLEVGPATVQELKEYLEVPGTVQAIDSRIGHVRSLAKGRLQSILAKVGDRVSRNQVLAEFDNIESGELVAQLDAADADLTRLRAQRDAAAKQLDRVRELVRIGASPQRELDSSQAEYSGLEASVHGQESSIQGLRARLRRFGLDYASARATSVTPIVSPFEGVVIDARIAPGEVVGEGADLFQIADLSRVWVQAEVYEKDLARIRVGQPAFIAVDTYPDQKFIGNVGYIGDILDPKTRTAKVRCEVDNPGARLKLDMFAKVALPTTFSRKALAVPAGAIQQIEKDNVVFIKTGDTKFELRKVQVGRTINQIAEITAGLRPGEQVVSAGAFHLKAMMLGGELGEKE